MVEEGGGGGHQGFPAAAARRGTDVSRDFQNREGKGEEQR